MLEGKSGENSSIGRHMRRLEDNIKMSLKPGARMCTPFIWPGLKYNSVFLLTDKWPVPTQTAPRAVSTSVCKPEAANRVEVPDDERHNARNMLNY